MPLVVTFREDDWIAKCDKCGQRNFGSDMEFAPLQVTGGGISQLFVCKRHKVKHYYILDLPLLTFDDPSPVPVARPDATYNVFTAVPVPTLTSITPATSTLAAFLAAGCLLALVGTNFSPSFAQSMVRINGVLGLATYVSSTQLTAKVDGTVLAAGTYAIDVLNSGPPFIESAPGVSEANLAALNLSNSKPLVLT